MHKVIINGIEYIPASEAYKVPDGVSFKLMQIGIMLSAIQEALYPRAAQATQQKLPLKPAAQSADITEVCTTEKQRGVLNALRILEVACTNGERDSYTFRDAAEMAGCSHGTVWSWVNYKAIPAGFVFPHLTMRPGHKIAPEKREPVSA